MIPEMPEKFLDYDSFFRSIAYGDWYIDWCTGIDGYYSGPHKVKCMECLDNAWVVSWGMLQKVNASVPSLIINQWM